MRTRTLLILAAICGVLILGAGGIKLLQVSTDRAEVDTLALDEQSRVGDMTVSVTEVTRLDDAIVVEVSMSGVADADPLLGWRLWADGKSTLGEPLEDERSTCAGRTVPSEGTLSCSLVFDPADTIQGVIYLRAGEQRQWVP